MKSRFSLRTSSALQSDAPLTGRPLAARAGEVSLARRFELKHNTSPRFARRRQQRRQGQALLLAVLIMLLAALLSAGFLAVVSGNLNQTARIADKTKAIEASRAGIAYANAQLSGSADGDRWRPVDVSPAPDPNNPATAGYYNQYYSQLDRVQGWAAGAQPIRGNFAAGVVGDEAFRLAVQNYRNTTYGKFPDPNQSLSDAPKFSLKVEEIPTLPTAAGYDAEHAGEIKITSIGLSDDDPNVFHKSVAYKVGRRKSPFASALRSISNWRFGTNDNNTGVPSAPVFQAVTNVPRANVDVLVNTTNTPAFDNAEAPFNVVIVRKNGGASSVRGAVVTQVTPPAANANPPIATLKLARLDSAVLLGDVIQKAAALGTAQEIDLLNTGKSSNQNPQQVPVNFLTFPSQSQPNGIMANGSIWLQGQIGLSELSKFGTKIYSSGSIALDNSNKPVSAPANPPTPNYGIAGNGVLASSSSVNFPGTFTTDSGADVEPLDLVQDGWNNINTQILGLDYSPDTRDVKPFKPIKIDSAENLARFRALTRNSANGVYIDNSDDIEKVPDNVTLNPPTFKAMTQAQLIDMLTSPTAYPLNDPTGRFYTRKSPAPPVATVASLEQRHLRGWVGPDEFIARGALVELRPSVNTDLGPDAPNPFIRVTYDSRSDLNSAGPELTKTLRDANGNYQRGVYSQDIVWPANGTLFAEGNIRIRGDVTLPRVAPGQTDRFPSLTVASLGNIYIEGKLSLDNTFDNPGPNQTIDPNRKKLMLLAKKNVIVNPTRAVLARTDVQTIATNLGAVAFTGRPAAPSVNAASDTKSVSVANASLFNVGDYVTIGLGQNKSVRGIVTDVFLQNKQIEVRTNDTFTIPPANTATIFNVRSALEERVADDPTVATPANFFSLVDTENAINRRVLSPVYQGIVGNTTNINNKLVFNHFAERKQTNGTDDGLNVKAEDATLPAPAPRPGSFVAQLTSKQLLQNNSDDNNTVPKSLVSTERILRTYNNYPALPDATNKRVFTSTAAKSILDIATEISSISESNAPDPAPQGYKYTATATNPLFNTLPSQALTGVGLRYDPRATYIANQPSNNRKDFNVSTNNPDGYTIPLATTVEFDLNGAIGDIRAVNDTRTIPYFGFAPSFQSSEDALTIDSGFYQLRTQPSNSTMDLRPLRLPITNSPGIGGFTSVLPSSVVFRRSGEYSSTTHTLLPNYFVRGLKIGTVGSSDNEILPSGGIMQINAFVYAQEGSWFVIPGDYFRSDLPIRAQVNPNTGAYLGSYIDYNNNTIPDPPTVGQPTEYVVVNGQKAADLNRNGSGNDPGEREAVLEYLRYNSVQIQFYGSVVENQTAVVADVIDPVTGNAVVKGSVQDWMDKWASYNDSRNVLNLGSVPTATGNLNNFKFIKYDYDPAIKDGSIGANQLRVPITDDLIYQQ